MRQLLLKLSKIVEVDFLALGSKTPVIEEQRRINLVNYISLISSFNMMAYVAIYCLSDFTLFLHASIFLTIASTLNLIIIGINKKGFFQLAKVLLAISTPFYMFYVSTFAFGTAPGFHTYLLVGALIPLFIWNLKKNIYPLAAISIIVLAYLTVEFIPLNIQPKINLSQNYIDVFRQTNVVVCFTAAGVAIAFYQRLYKKTEAQLLIQTEKLKISQKQKDKIYSIIGHDLRGPLGTFKGLSEIYLNNHHKSSSSERLDLIKSIHKNSVSIFNLLENLLDWARIQSGDKELVRSEFQLIEVIDDTAQLYTDLLLQKNLTLKTKIDDKIKVFADRHMVSTIFRNLVSNAIKFTPEKGKLEIKVSEENLKVEICVKDNGMGLSSEDIDKLFDMEKSYHISPLNKEKGSGLGLLLCKDFVERHKGNIWAKSEIGEGTEFYFTLPTVQ